jgi:hypothetical protein
MRRGDMLCSASGASQGRGYKLRRAKAERNREARVESPTLPSASVAEAIQRPRRVFAHERLVVLERGLERRYIVRRPDIA